nr:dynamin family protein [Methylomicrobium agile]
MTTDNIFDQLSQQAQQIEQNWNALYRDLVAAQSDNPHLSKDFKQFSELNDSFRKALQHLYNDLNAPTLILATTGTTSSGKSTLVNLLCGADLMPRMAQEMSAGVVYIKHSPEGRRHLKVHKTNRAKWKCGEWSDLSDKEIREKLTNIMDSFNQNRGENQPETPNIELTYPLACFSNPDELLNLSGLPQSTQFQLMDLPGLRNQGDITNAEVIQKCKDALCLVAYNMEETDENRRRELVQQVLKQVKNMGGSPARMLFVLNRIDVFRKDDGWQRRQEEHIDKVRKEIHNILHDGLPEHRDKLKDITYCPLSSLPALYALLIRAGSDRVADAGELENHFKPLINDVLGDLPRDINKWSDQDFKRISDTAWKSSYGAEFYSCLGSHIQRHFPALVIPSIVKRFVNQVQEDIGRLDRTCEAQLNSSDENFEKAQKKLAEQEAKLKEFIAEAKQQLLRPIGRLNETLKKRQKIQGNLKELNDEFEKRPESKRESLLEFIKSGGELQKSDANSVVTSYLLASDGELNYLLASDGELKELVEKIISYKKELDALSMDSVLDIFIEGLLDTEIFQSRLDENKLRPLSDWEFQLRKSATEVLDAMKQSLVNGSPSFAGTSVENLPKSLQDHLAFICKRYARDLKDFSQISDNSRKDDIQESLDMFLDGLNNIVTECLELQSQQESKRIHDAMDLLMKTYLRYLQAGIDGIAREWNLNMGESVLDGLSPPEIGPVRLQSELKSDWRDERIWWTLWLSTKRIYYKTLPDPEALHVSFHHDIVNQVGMRAEVFSRMIIDYIDQLNDKIDLKQEFVQRDFDAKLIQAHQQHRNDYQKAQQCWLPLYEQSQQVVDQLKQLNEEYL